MCSFWYVVRTSYAINAASNFSNFLILKWHLKVEHTANNKIENRLIIRWEGKIRSKNWFWWALWYLQYITMQIRIVKRLIQTRAKILTLIPAPPPNPQKENNYPSPLSEPSNHLLVSYQLYQAHTTTYQTPPAPYQTPPITYRAFLASYKTPPVPYQVPPLPIRSISYLIRPHPLPYQVPHFLLYRHTPYLKRYLKNLVSTSFVNTTEWNGRLALAV